MEEKNIKYDCHRGCDVIRGENGEIAIEYDPSCCKRSTFNWLEGITSDKCKDLYEIRFKNTRKGIYRNDSGQNLKTGDLVVVEATNGHDVGIITLEGAMVARQILRNKINIENFEFKKIYRKAKILDIERWQEAIAREHQTMIRSRQIAAGLNLDMKIGDVEFQGDGAKATFYYIADERVDFRQLIKDFADEFHIKIEMKQIGARQEAGLIGGIGVCGRALCCSCYMANFLSITTQTARCQDLLNPQKYTGQCGKLKCCINYEAETYADAHNRLPVVKEPLAFDTGLAYLVKTDVLQGVLWFSFDKGNMAHMFPLTAEKVFEIQKLNKQGHNAVLEKKASEEEDTQFVSAVGDDSITRFDHQKKSNKKKKKHHDKKKV